MIRMGSLVLSLAMFLASNGDGCDETTPPQSASGVQQATVEVKKGADGLTVEQRNVRDRLAMDNKPGSIKHLYVISAYSGQVILYSTVRGKVTSSGKRLTPTSVNGSGSDTQYTIPVEIGGHRRYTNEVLQDDGTYGSSIDYIYWWDVQGRYHQHYPNGGQIIHVSDQPIPIKSVIINIEAVKEQP